MRVLLFGGAGYIGSHAALAFLERGDTVGVYDNFSSGLRENVYSDALLFEGDILDNSRLNEVMAKGWDAVIHLAAFKAAGESMTEPQKYSINNICGSLNIITACVTYNVPRFILSSSAAVYGEPEYLPIDEDHPTRPENYYGYTKLAIEGHLKWFDQLRGLKFVSLRYFNAAGYDPFGKMTGLERNPANLIPVIMETAVGKRKTLKIFGNDYDTIDGTGVRDYIHVTDLADAHVRAVDFLEANNSSLIVNIGSESGLSVVQILESARSISGKDIPTEFVGRRPGDPAKLVASSENAKRILGWKPKFSDLQTLISSTWNVYKKHFME
ncbi:MAG: UDP-glucose 4-epimerase GalE [Spirochaetia bacterium]|nr:UDP-glucose 4-epimerase GalE [Spirochaetia bacterium]MCF7953812.1 UDP-glucose 4-epimerase GalE [Spirochaetales bacterium]